MSVEMSSMKPSRSKSPLLIHPLLVRAWQIISVSGACHFRRWLLKMWTAADLADGSEAENPRCINLGYRALAAVTAAVAGVVGCAVAAAAARPGSAGSWAFFRQRSFPPFSHFAAAVDVDDLLKLAVAAAVGSEA